MWVAPEEIPSHPVFSAFAAYLQGGIKVKDWAIFLDKNPWLQFGAICLKDGSWQLEVDGMPDWIIDYSTFIDLEGTERVAWFDGAKKVLLIR